MEEASYETALCLQELKNREAESEETGTADGGYETVHEGELLQYYYVAVHSTSYNGFFRLLVVFVIFLIGIILAGLGARFFRNKARRRRSELEHGQQEETTSEEG